MFRRMNKLYNGDDEDKPKTVGFVILLWNQIRTQDECRFVVTFFRNKNVNIHWTCVLVDSYMYVPWHKALSTSSSVFTESRGSARGRNCIFAKVICSAACLFADCSQRNYKFFVYPNYSKWYLQVKHGSLIPALRWTREGKQLNGGLIARYAVIGGNFLFQCVKLC